MPKFLLEYLKDKLIVAKNKNPMWRVLLAESYGEDCGDHIVLHPFETIYLLMKGKAKINDKQSRDAIRDIVSKAVQRDPNFVNKLSAYLDLRERGFVVKILKNKRSIIFEVFDRQADITLDESRCVIMVVQAEKSIGIEDLDTALSEAKKINKMLVLAIVDQDGDIVYYKVDSTLRFGVSLRLRKTHWL